MPEAASFQNDDAVLDITAVAAIPGGTVIQLPDGRAAVVPSDLAAGELGGAQTEGIFILPKTTGIVLLDGGRVFWDYSANKAHFKQVNDRDFYLGTIVGDAASAATTVKVNLNKRQSLKSDLFADNFTSVIIGTAAAGGFGYPLPNGGGVTVELTSTAEAQKVDALGVQGIAPGSKAIVEGAFRVLNDGAGTAADVSLGVASATHATDADSIAESCFIHLNANDTNIYAESDDGTTEVAATDTTVDYTEGSALATRVEFWMDLRDLTDIQIYLDGVLILPATVFKLNLATGPLFPLVHLEKTSAADVYKIAVDWLRVRTAGE